MPESPARLLKMGIALLVIHELLVVSFYAVGVLCSMATAPAPGQREIGEANVIGAVIAVGGLAGTANGIALVPNPIGILAAVLCVIGGLEHLDKERRREMISETEVVDRGGRLQAMQGPM